MPTSHFRLTKMSFVSETSLRSYNSPDRFDSPSSSLDSQSVESQHSLSSRSGGKRYTYVWKRYKWTSHREYLMISTAFNLSLANCYSFMTLRTDVDAPNLIHYIVVYIVVGLPLVYMEVIVGQYAQLGVIFIKLISPLAHGVGYCLLLLTGLRCVSFGVVMADFLLYLLTSMQEFMPWLHCPDNSSDYCWGIDDVQRCREGKCSDVSKISSFVYWKVVYMQNISVKIQPFALGWPIVTRLVTLSLGWIMIFGIVLLGINRYKKVIRMNLMIIFICMIILLTVSLCTKGSTLGIRHMFVIHPKSLINMHAWIEAVFKIIVIVNIGRSAHVLYGSQMSPTAPSDILTIMFVLIHFLGTFFGSMVTLAMLGIVSNFSQTPITDFSAIWMNEPYFTIIPLGVGCIGVRQLWTILYFMTYLLLIINCILTHLDATERNIADAHENLRAYQKYTLSTLCLVCFLLGILVLSKEAHPILSELFWSICVYAFAIILVCLSVCVFWIYRVQRFSDDIHFLLGFQPTKFWKICWYINPLILLVSTTCLLFLADVQNNIMEDASDFRTIMTVLLVSPIPILWIVEIFSFLKDHNLVGLLQPQERWGPPDPAERHLRRLFNPREEIKSRKRNDACHHKCLRNSKVLKNIIKDETFYRGQGDNPDEIELNVQEDSRSLLDEAVHRKPSAKFDEAVHRKPSAKFV